MFKPKGIIEVNLDLITEEFKPLPGNDKGYVDYHNIDGNEVHVHFKHRGSGRYSVMAYVNGKLHSENKSKLPGPTRVKIVRAVSSSVKEFGDKFGYKELQVKGNSGQKASIYRSKSASVSPTAQPTSSGFVDRRPDATYKPSGEVKNWDKDDPAYKKPEGGKKRDKDRAWKEPMGSGKSAKDKKWMNKKIKDKGDLKGAKFEGKGAAKAGK